jgi:putative ABC transport system substrate-binding protein
MRRREVIAVLAGAAVALPLRPRAQSARPKRLGVIIQGGPDYPALAGLREGLKAGGLLEGVQVDIIIQKGSGGLAEVETAARMLEEEACNAIVAFSTSIALAARRGTSRVPIVFTAGTDPVAFGLVESLAKPGGRLTGVHSVQTDATAKRFELLYELVPGLKRVVTFYNPANPIPIAALAAAQEPARRFGVEMAGIEVRSPAELRERVEALKPADADAYFFVSDAMVHAHSDLIVAKATALRIPAVAYEPDPVAKGALASYGADYRELGRAAARYVARIFAGAEPRDLPVERIDRPSFTINLKTAKALSLTIPPTLLARADEVIE